MRTDRIELIKRFIASQLKIREFTLKYRDEYENELDIDIEDPYDIDRDEHETVLGHDIEDDADEIDNDQENESDTEIGDAVEIDRDADNNIGNVYEVGLLEAFDCAHIKNAKQLQIFVYPIPSYTFPLCQFSTMNICNVIKQWRYNDINYKPNLFKLEKLFIRHNVCGETFVIKTPKPSWKDILTTETLGFMTEDTINVILNGIDEWMQTAQAAIRWKSPRQMARILYHYPLKQLMHALHKDNIDG
eukprot:919623_1